MKESGETLTIVAEEAFSNAQEEAEILKRENVRLKKDIMSLRKRAEAASSFEKENEKLKVELGALKLRATAAEESLQAKGVTSGTYCRMQMKFQKVDYFVIQGKCDSFFQIV